MLLIEAGLVNMPDYEYCPTYSVSGADDVACGAMRVDGHFTQPLLGLFNYIRTVFGKPSMQATDQFRVCVPDMDNVQSITEQNVTISDWNGIFPTDPVPVFDASRMNPTLPVPTVGINVATKTYPLFELTCQGNMFLLPGHGLQMSLGAPKMDDHINALFTMVESIETCRKNVLHPSGSFAAGEINARYIAVDPAFLMFYLNNNLNDYSSMITSTGMTDLVSKLFRNRPGTYRMELPSTCSKSMYMAGKCDFSLTLLNNITGIDNVIRVQIETCTAPNQHRLPHVIIDCQGEGCGLFLRPIACDDVDGTQGMCPNGTVCTNMSRTYNVSFVIILRLFRERYWFYCESIC